MPSVKISVCKVSVQLHPLRKYAYIDQELEENAIKGQTGFDSAFRNFQKLLCCDISLFISCLGITDGAAGWLRSGHGHAVLNKAQFSRTHKQIDQTKTKKGTARSRDGYINGYL